MHRHGWKVGGLALALVFCWSQCPGMKTFDGPAMENRRGELKKEDGDFEGALVHFHRALELQNDPSFEPSRVTPGVSENGVWHDIGECHEELENVEAAVHAYLRASSDERWYPPLIELGNCLHRHLGLETAVAWFEHRVATRDEDDTNNYLLASFLLEAGEHERSLPYFARAVDLLARKQGFEFDETGELILTARTRGQDQSHFASIVYELDGYSRALVLSKRMEEAHRVSTMGISIGKQVRRLAGYYDDDEIEVGNVDCRLMRTRVYVHWEDWPCVRTELALARTGSKRSAYIGWKEDIRYLDELLAKVDEP